MRRVKLSLLGVDTSQSAPMRNDLAGFDRETFATSSNADLSVAPLPPVLSFQARVCYSKSTQSLMQMIGKATQTARSVLSKGCMEIANTRQ